MMEQATAKARTMDGETLVREYIVTQDARTKDRAVRAFLPLVKHIAGRINLSEFGVLRREDIYQFGVLGLLSALDRYKLGKGASFKTFAYRRIHGEIIDAIRREGLMSKDSYRLYRKIQDESDHLRQELGREPTPEEIGERLGLTVEEYQHLLANTDPENQVSLDDSAGKSDEDSLKRLEVIEDEDQVSPDRLFADKALKDELKAIIKKLPERQRLILALYYYEELTLADIGIVLGLSESRISQIMTQTLAEIRIKLRSTGGRGNRGR